MASATSRWADTAEDTAREAQRRREKEEKKRLRAADKARKEAEKRAQEAEVTRIAADTDDARGGRPPKRRKTTPEATPDTARRRDGLLRLRGGTLAAPCGSVEAYEKLNDIEEGAYGWVARARDRATGAVVALKRLKLDAADRGGLPVTGLREMQLLHDCHHDNIVRLLAVVEGAAGTDEAEGVDDEADASHHHHHTSRLAPIFLVLEFVEHDLKTVLEDMPQPFLASEIKTLLRQLTAGVAYLHDHWILHRDLKTSNLLLSNRGRLKIADFGMARYADADATTCSATTPLTALVVTLWYRAPELLLGARSYGRAVDLWSIGCIFGELLTREPLLQGRNEADALVRIFALCGVPTDTTWPGFRRLPNARALQLPPATGPPPAAVPTATIRARFPLLTAAGCQLLASLLALDPARRPTAQAVLDHEYFRQDPRAKPEALFPTFPSKAGQERRRRRNTPDAPARGAAAHVDLGAVDFASIFAARDREERGAGFSLRMV